MRSAIGSFCKSEECPASQELLAFQIGQVPAELSTDIRQHLRDCEFCTAEVELYQLYPPTDETIIAEKMPQPLFDLAKDLLRKDRDLSPLYRLVDAG